MQVQVTIDLIDLVPNIEQQVVAVVQAQMAALNLSSEQIGAATIRVIPAPITVLIDIE